METQTPQLQQKTTHVSLLVLLQIACLLAPIDSSMKIDWTMGAN